MLHPVLLYHSISNSNQSKYAHNVTPQNFIKQINFLSFFFEFCFVDDLYIKTSRPKLALTFDDAYKNLNDIALPFLHSLSIPATIFWCPGISSKPFWRDMIRVILSSEQATQHFISYFNLQFPETPITPTNLYSVTKSAGVNSLSVEEIARDTIHRFSLSVESHTMDSLEISQVASKYKNIKIGNHSLSHHNLCSLTDEQLFHDIDISQSQLHDIFPQSKLSNYYSIPFGGSDSFNHNIINYLRDADFAGCLLSRSRLQIAKTKCDVSLNQVITRPKHFVLIERIMPSDTGLFGLLSILFKSLIRSVYYIFRSQLFIFSDKIRSLRNEKYVY